MTTIDPKPPATAPGWVRSQDLIPNDQPLLQAGWGLQIFPFWQGASVGKRIQKEAWHCFFFNSVSTSYFGKVDGLWSPISGLPNLCHADMLRIQKVQVLWKYWYLSGTSFYVSFLLSNEPPVICIHTYSKWFMKCCHFKQSKDFMPILSFALLRKKMCQCQPEHDFVLIFFNYMIERATKMKLPWCGMDESEVEV